MEANCLELLFWQIDCHGDIFRMGLSACLCQNHIFHFNSVSNIQYYLPVMHCIMHSFTLEAVVLYGKLQKWYKYN